MDGDWRGDKMIGVMKNAIRLKMYPRIWSGEMKVIDEELWYEFSVQISFCCC